MELRLLHCNEVVVLLRQGFGDVGKLFLGFLKELTFVVVTDKVHRISCPTACVLRCGRIAIAAASFAAFAKQVREDASPLVHAPFPQLGNAANIPRSDILFLGLIDGIEILSHAHHLV